MTARYWILFLWLAAVVVAFILRYVLARFFLIVPVSGAGRGIHINIIAFWLILGAAGVVTLIKLIRAR